MSRTPVLRSLLEDDAWRVALVAGVAALPFTTASYVRTGTEIDFGPVFYAGLLAGYLYGSGATDRSRVATRVGIIGAVPVLWQFGDMVLYIGTEMVSPPGFRAFTVVIAAAFTLLSVGFAVVLAMIGAWVGDWLGGTVGRIRVPGIGH
ncbi:DUF5518 domain-containing protein [Natrinema gari]|uniref:DUF5518 domain-containing protein n=1 Tax=Natrinema gari JCM 14663 TaxID=1230459 RepID=L9YW56_9EURY|nr:DUF5518 domain-containing protein [Natrinema gari]ELY77717.1 hypothetical protein C486_14839 [Natrinema gari JCM 14663]